jgi:protein SCO1/2
VDTDGNPVTDSKYRGKYLIVYFGFTNCPDICPEEMKKIATVMDTLDPKLAENITPLFITLDPNRDSCKAVEEYVSGMPG